MSSIFLIVQEAHGPCGHGTQGDGYLSLMCDGDSFELGSPYPAFTSREDAEQARKTNDRFNFYKVIELEVKR